MMSVSLFLAQAAAGEWSPIPFLSIATILALAAIAAAAGIVKNRTDNTAERVGKLETKFDESMEKMREEQAERHRENRADMEKIRDSLNDLYLALGRQPDQPRGYRR